MARGVQGQRLDICRYGPGKGWGPVPVLLIRSFPPLSPQAGCTTR